MPTRHLKNRFPLAAALILTAVVAASAEVPSNPDEPKTYHVGNSLTDTVVNTLAPMASSAGRTHVLRRCTIPGAPTDFIWKVDGHKGFGESDFTKTFKDQAPFACIITQPFSAQEIATL